MSDYLDKWKQFLEEGSQWGGFTGGAAPLDEPTPDSGPIPPEQLRKMWSIYTEMGMSPEEILQTPEFVEAGIVSPEQLQEDDVRDTYDDEVEKRNEKSRKQGAEKMGLEERCQKGYKTHKTRKTKKMYGKTYRNCIKAEGEEKSRHAKELAKNRKKGYSPQAAVTAIPDHEESDKAYYKSLNKKKKKKGMSESELASRESLEEMIKKELMDMLNK